MGAEDVTAGIELADLRGAHEPSLPDEIGGDEAMSSQAKRFQPVGDERVVRDAPVIEGEQRRSLAKAGELRLEMRDRQLVAVGCRRSEAALEGIRRIHIMKEQGYGSHVASGGPPISNVDTRSAAADPRLPIRVLRRRPASRLRRGTTRRARRRWRRGSR